MRDQKRPVYICECETHTCVIMSIRMNAAMRDQKERYGVAMISRLLKMIGLFCKRALYKRPYSAKDTYNFKEPTNRSHPIPQCGIKKRVQVYICECENTPVRVTMCIHINIFL